MGQTQLAAHSLSGIPSSLLYSEGDKILATLKPLNDCLWIDPEPSPEYHLYKQYAHVVIPEKYAHGPEDRPVWGKVLAKGKGCQQPEIQVGSRIVFGKWAPARILYQEKEYILIREVDVLAVDGSTDSSTP